MQTASILEQAIAAVGAKRFTDAERLVGEVLAAEPTSSRALHVLGVVARQTGRIPLAIDSLKKALHHDPDHPGIHFELGAARYEAYRLEEAADSFRRAAELKPDFQEALVDLGSVLDRLGRFEEALAACEAAVRLQPDCQVAHFNAANCLRGLGRINESIEHFQTAIRLKPDFAKAHWNLACCALLAGEFETGWREYDWREAAEEVAIDRYPQPRWRGEPLAGKNLLIHAEQGIGDEILFATCLPELIPKAGKCIIVCDPRLQKLFARSFPTAIVFGYTRRKDRAPANIPDRIDFQVPAGSLPGILRRTSQQSVRRRLLIADPSARAAWRQRYEALGPGLKVGISWQAGGQPAERLKRTTDLCAWQDILQAGNVQFINLQYGDVAEELDRVERQLGVRVHDWPVGDPLIDLDEFAAKVAALDLVISVGNATVHIAGALGVPTWNLLPVIPGWRWMLHGEECIWYPSVRLIRQRRHGDWEPVFNQVTGDLRELLKARGFSSEPRSRQKIDVDEAAPAKEFGTKQTASFARLTDVTSVLESAKQAHEHGQRDRAEQLCRDVLDHSPRNVRALHLLGVIARETRRYDVAIRMFNRAVAINPVDATLRMNLGAALSDAGQLLDAIEQLREAVQLAPQNAMAHLALGQAYWRIGSTADAQRSFYAASQVDPAFAKAFNAHGAARLALHNYPEAETALRRAIDLQPDYMAAWNNLGLALRALNRPDEAKQCFRRALQFDANASQARASLAELDAPSAGDRNGVNQPSWRLDVQPHSPVAPQHRSTTLTNHPHSQ